MPSSVSCPRARRAANVARWWFPRGGIIDDALLVDHRVSVTSAEALNTPNKLTTAMLSKSLTESLGVLAAGEGWVSVMSCCAPDPDADAQSILTRVARTLSGSTVTQTQWLMCAHTWVDILAP